MKVWRFGAGLDKEDERKLKMVKPLITVGVGLAAGAALLALFKPLLGRLGRRGRKDSSS